MRGATTAAPYESLTLHHQLAGGSAKQIAASGGPACVSLRNPLVSVGRSGCSAPAGRSSSDVLIAPTRPRASHLPCPPGAFRACRYRAAVSHFRATEVSHEPISG